MAPRRTRSELDPGRADSGFPDGDPGSVVRRAPFSDNPTVGARGQRTQQRILDGALAVFGETGYRQSNIDRITKRAGCSRVAFYQYFSSKEDVFRHLAGQVARQLSASSEALAPVTPDLAGWTTLRAWIARHGEVYDRYVAVFQSLEDAQRSDEAMAAASLRARDLHVALIRSRLATTDLAPRELDSVIALLLGTLSRAHHFGAILRSAAPESYPIDRLNDAVTDLVHRTLFGLHAAVNVHEPAPHRPPTLTLGKSFRDALLRQDAADGDVSRRTMAALVGAGREVFVAMGFHATRVDDIVKAAGVSHGVFYRYFENKAELAHLLAVRAMRTMSIVLAEVPAAAHVDSATGRAALRRWLRKYNTTHAAEAAMVRVWVDATLQDEALGGDSAAAVDWGRRRLARFLQARDFGDHDIDAVVLLAVVDAFGTRPQSTLASDAAAQIIERGLLGC
jgi:AcrR family transcriptional regulator